VKRSHRSTRTPAHLSGSLDKRLNMYMLAAGATGVGLLALVQPAEGRIVYTPAHVIIGYGGVHSFAIDLNHDDIADFGIYMFANSCTSECAAGLWVKGATGSDDVEGKQPSSHRSSYAWALRPKAKIGPHAPFGDQGGLGDVMLGISSFPSTGHRNVSGRWNNVKNRYLGFKFDIHGKTHYGWARLNVRDKGHHITATLTGYAYETIPNKPIVAGVTQGWEHNGVEPSNTVAPTDPNPEPASLGRLAMGSLGLLVWRQKAENILLN